MPTVALGGCTQLLSSTVTPPNMHTGGPCVDTPTDAALPLKHGALHSLHTSDGSHCADVTEQLGDVPVQGSEMVGSEVPQSETATVAPNAVTQDTVR